MKLRPALVGLMVAVVLVGAACSGDEGASTSTTVEVTTTTVPPAPCTREGLTLAGAAVGPDINFDTATEFACEGDYAYVWLVDSSKSDSPTLSEIFRDEDGTWEPVTGPLCDGTAAGNVPARILEQGCVHADPVE